MQTVNKSRKRVRLWLAGLVLVACLGVSGCSAGEEYKNMRFDAGNLEELTDEFFRTGEPSRSECVQRLDNMTWQRSGGKLGSQRTVMFEYDRDGFNYNFFYVDKTDKIDPYHLTVRVHTVRNKGYELLHGAALVDNRFGTGIGSPSDDLVKNNPETKQDKWNRKVLEEYTGILKCFFDEQHDKK